MSQLTFEHFDKENKFLKMKFESPYIRSFSPEEECIFQFKRILKTDLIFDNKKKKTLFAIILENYIKDNLEASFEDIHQFSTENEAIEFFEGMKQEAEGFSKWDRENKIFDGRRYMLELNENGEIIGRC